MPIRRIAILCVFLASIAAGAARAAGADAPHVDGSAMGLVWLVPFAAILAGIALGPLLFAHAWHAHYGKYALGCAAAFLVPCAAVFGIRTATYEFVHAMLIEYVPFIVMLFALYVVAGGVRLKGAVAGTPAANTAILAAGTAIASLTGTTGACMLLAPVLLRANAGRTRNAHVFVFFIFLVGNIGGALSPLGDPPLFIGFLEGVDFFWVTTRMLAPMLVLALPLLAAFYLLDRHLLVRDATAAAVLLSGIWRAGWRVEIFHTPVEGESLARTMILLVLAGLSLVLTGATTRERNGFTWEPIAEVAKLFVGIFVTIVPAIAIIRAGGDGALGGLVALLSRDGRPDDAAYFWTTGLLSAFLDNAPTYLLFFNLAGGDAETLMGPLARTLLAISAGSVFMGALTYIGNAPNFMVKAMAEARGVKMPSFFGFMGWSCAFLLPPLALVAMLFFRM